MEKELIRFDPIELHSKEQEIFGKFYDETGYYIPNSKELRIYVEKMRQETDELEISKIGEGFKYCNDNLYNICNIEETIRFASNQKVYTPQARILSYVLSVLSVELTLREKYHSLEANSAQKQKLYDDLIRTFNTTYQGKEQIQWFSSPHWFVCVSAFDGHRWLNEGKVDKRAFLYRKSGDRAKYGLFFKELLFIKSKVTNNDATFPPFFDLIKDRMH